MSSLKTTISATALSLLAALSFAQQTHTVSVKINQGTDCAIVSVEKEPPSVISVFPNPTSSKIFLHARENIVGIEVLDAFGRGTTVSVLPSKNTEVDLSHLPRGLYMLSVRFVATRERYKIILK